MTDLENPEGKETSPLVSAFIRAFTDASNAKDTAPATTASDDFATLGRCCGIVGRRLAKQGVKFAAKVRNNTVESVSFSELPRDQVTEIDR